MFRGLVRTHFYVGTALALCCWLCCASDAHAQGVGGGQQGGGFGGQTGGSSFSGTSTGSIGRNTFPGVTSGFRPPSSGSRSSALRGGGQFGQLGGGQFGQGGQLGGGQAGGGLTGGGLAGRGLNSTVPTRITGAAVSENIKPIPPPFLDIQGRLETLVSNSAGAFAGRSIVLEVEGPVLVMRGTVRDDYEKQLTEALARLEPGVHEIRNELTVAFPRRPPADLPPGLERPPPSAAPARSSSGTPGVSPPGPGT